MGAAAPKPPHAIHPHSKLWGILAFSHEKDGLVIICPPEGKAREFCKSRESAYTSASIADEYGSKVPFEHINYRKGGHGQ